MTALYLKCSKSFFIYLFKGFKAILVKVPKSYNNDKNKRKRDKKMGLLWCRLYLCRDDLETAFLNLQDADHLCPV